MRFENVVFVVSLVLLPTLGEAQREVFAAPDPIAAGTEECLDPTPAEVEEARDKLQKWINDKAPEAKTHQELAERGIEKFDKAENGQKDKKLSKDEIEVLLEEADIGNWLTRSCWASELVKKFDGDGDDKLSESEIEAGLRDIGLKPPKAPSPTPTPGAVIGRP